MALADVHSSPTDMQSVGLKAYSRLTAEWRLTLREAAQLLDVSESTWKRIKAGQFSGDLTRDQMLRLSALVGLYKALALYFDSPLSEQWVKLENTGPLFDGQRPLARMIEGGLPTIIAVRTYVDALRGGA